MSPGSPSVEVDRSGRIRSLSVAWFSDGARLRAEARRARRCVECGKELPTRRSPYCSRRCRWAFHGHYFWDSARTYVLARDRYTCRLCGTRHRKRELEVDHRLEIARGGAALEYSNLQTVCRSCHRAKTRAFLTTTRASGSEEVPEVDHGPVQGPPAPVPTSAPSRPAF